MEPVTHFLTGACIGRAGFNRKTAYATLAAVLASEAADLDVLWGFGGPVDSLKHHRGITHTFWAVPVVAGAVVGAVWLIHRLNKSRVRPEQTSVAPSLSSAQAKNKGGTAHPLVSGARPHPPIRWGWLYLAAFVSALSHLLLDWTNNYGLRPLFPFNPRWYAGSFMFIAEPILWLVFLVALVTPWLLGLADREIGARRAPFRGRAWAVFALAAMTVLFCWRWAEHAQALALLDNINLAAEPATRIAAEPYPVNPFRWHAIVETADFYQTAEIDTRTDAIDSDAHRDVLYKPADTPAVEAAKRTYLGQVFLDWGTWAVVRDVGQEPIPGLDPPQLPPGRTWTTVEFTDLRFRYPFLGAGSAARAPLSGSVYIVDGRDDAGECLNGRAQR